MSHRSIADNLAAALKALNKTDADIERESRRILKRKPIGAIAGMPQLKPKDKEKFLRSTRLSLAQIDALDELFAKQGGLAAALRPRTLLSQMSGRNVVFLMGSRVFRESGARFVSAIDCRAFSSLLLGIEQEVGRSGDTHFDLREICDDNVPQDAWTSVGQLLREVEEKDTNVICIGSPKSNAGTEAFLGRMLPRASSTAPPFKFFWRGATKTNFCEATAGPPRLEYGLDGERKQVQVNDNGDDSVTWGLIASQRQSATRSMSVICGLTGAATLGLTEMLRHGFRYDLPPFHGLKREPVSWLVVKVGFKPSPGGLAFDFTLRGVPGEADVEARGAWA